MRPHFSIAIAATALSLATAANANDWTGFYAGVNAGYAFSNSNSIDTSSVPGPCDPVVVGCTSVPNYSTLFALGATGSVDGELDGFIIGGQLGYNLQMQDWVWGLETDIQAMAGSDGGGTYTVVTPSPAFPAQPVTTTFTASRSLDFLGTLRARAGYLYTPKALVYATAGLAYGGTDLNASYNATCTACTWTTPPNGVFGASDTLTGWTVGVGGEWAFAPNWTFKTEYLYYDLADTSVTGQIVGTVPPSALVFVTHSPTISSDFDGHLIRVGANFKF